MSLVRLTIVFLIGLLAACASREYRPEEHYDVNAYETMGRVVNKRIAATDVRPSAQSRPGFIFVPIGGTLTPLVVSNVRDDSYIDIYEYTVDIDGVRKVSVYSEFSGHSLGECVKIFESLRPGYPRIALGYGCKNAIDKSKN